MRSLIRFALPLGLAALCLFLILRPTPPAPLRHIIVERTIAGPRVWYHGPPFPRLTQPGGDAREVRSLLNVTRPMRFGEYVWNEERVPATGDRWIRIDLTRQTLSLFRGGHEIGSAIILYGTDGKPTPTGTFPILERAAEHRSTLYDAEMPFMLRLTNDGVAIHASNVRYGSATHGCIGVPPAFAKLLFAAVRRGDPVSVLVGDDAAKSRLIV